MAFSIKQIKALLSEHNMPVDDLDKAAEDICARHTADLESIKEQRDSYKKDAETLASVQKELDALKESTKDGKNPYEVKYNALKEEYAEYKKGVTEKETKAKKETAYKGLLKEAGVSDKRIDAVLRVSDVNSLEFDDDGKVKNHDDLIKGIKSEWEDFIVTEIKAGAKTATPPKSEGGYKSREEIYKKDESGRFILDASQRQAELSKLIASERS